MCKPISGRDIVKKLRGTRRAYLWQANIDHEISRKVFINIFPVQNPYQLGSPGFIKEPDPVTAHSYSVSIFGTTEFFAGRKFG